MTKKDYKFVADLLSQFPNGQISGDKAYLVGKFADYFAKDNPKFDSFKFFQACGLV